MAYEVILEAGEQVEAAIELNLSRRVHPFHFVVSNRALYIPRKKLIAKTDPHFFQRVIGSGREENLRITSGAGV